MVRQLVMVTAVLRGVASEHPTEEQASLIQVRGRGRALLGVYARAAEAIRTAEEHAENICTQAETGDVAPVAGSFQMEGGDTLQIQAGYTAPKPGVFCISKETMALVERAHGFANRKAIEAALTKKEGGTNPWGQDGVFAGKYNKPTTCEDVPAECKMSVYPMRHNLCTILWTMQNQWMDKLPGCGTGAEARRNIEGACFRDAKLRLTCPLTCEDSMEVAKTIDDQLDASYVCWAGNCDTNATSIKVNAYIEAEIQKGVDQIPDALATILNADRKNDVYPCHPEATMNLCEEHCPSTCQMLLDGAVATGTETAEQLCSASCTGSHAETATTWNENFVSSLSAVQNVLKMEAAVTGPCDAASVQAVCSQHCQ